MEAYIPIFSSIESNFHIQLSEAVQEKIVDHATIDTIEKNGYLLHMGDEPKYFYFIISGLLRGYYLDEQGTEVTNCFIDQGEFCCSFAVAQSLHSEFFIQALEDSRYLQVELELIRYLIQEKKEIQELFNRLSMKGISYYRNRSKALVMQSASQRYQMFRKDFPSLEERVEQRYIASYLGITPSSLSRLKREMAKYKN